MKTTVLIILLSIVGYYLLFLFFRALVSANGKDELDGDKWSSEKEYYEKMLDREVHHLALLQMRENNTQNQQDISVCEHNIYLLKKKLSTYYQ